MSTLFPIVSVPESPATPGDALSPAAQRAEEEKNRMRRYFQKPGSQSELSAVAGHEPVLPVSRDDEPLQPAVHHLPAHLRAAGAGGRHALGAVYLAR